ncbi:MAG: hypothetical protein AB7I19_14135 [Planctomycetota bacterium]
MPGRKSRGIGSARFLLGVAAWSCLSACTTEDVPHRDDFDALLGAEAVVIPLADPGHEATAADAYYQSVVAQMRQAGADRDLDWLEFLLAQHDRTDAPDWCREALLGFRKLARLLRAERSLTSRLVLRTRQPRPPLSDMLACELALTAEGDDLTGLILSGRDDPLAPARFHVRVRGEDRDAFGARFASGFEDILTVDRTWDLGREPERTLPFDLELPSPRGCERTVQIEIDLLPGMRQIAGERVPGGRVALVRSELVLHPLGIEAIEADPLGTLNAAIDRAEPRFFDHVWLASRRCTGEARARADARLIEALRLGTPDLGAVAAAALAEAHDTGIPITDREGWLRWWQERSVIRTNSTALPNDKR